VDHGLEAPGDFATHALSGRIGRDEVGMLGLDLLKFAEQLVVFRVGQLRLVEHVVGVIRTLEFGAQPHRALRSGGFFGGTGGGTDHALGNSLLEVISDVRLSQEAARVASAERPTSSQLRAIFVRRRTGLPKVLAEWLTLRP
jgi:hypothetical protein